MIVGLRAAVQFNVLYQRCWCSWQGVAMAVVRHGAQLVAVFTDSGD